MDFDRDRDRDRERPHFSTTTNTTTTEQQVFICFSSSRLSSSSSMKLTKSILSPARAARDPSHQLSSSLSRRNGSLKGGASPFFTTKKRGCGGGGAFENPEPSSPKVTCIGQVRVKTKKKVRQQTRNLSRRRSGKEGSSSSSFRKSDSDLASAHSRSGYHNQKQECFPHRTSSSSNNQKWAYFPSICEGFSCLFPCSSNSSKSSCFSTRSKCIGGGEKRGENGCGAVFTRWLVSVNDGEKRREIELVVGGGDDEEEDEEEERRRMSMRSSRRHVFDDIQIKDDRVIEVNNDEDDEGKEEGGRVSICIPPKNALLLMRCRSDPMKVAALASRFSWDANAGNQDKDGGEHEGEDEEEGRYSVDGFGGLFGNVKAAKAKDEIFMDTLGPLGNEEVSEAEGRRTSIEMGLGDNNDYVHEDDEKDEPVEIVGDEMVVEYVDEMEKDTVVEEGDELEEEVESNMDSFEALLDQENAAGATVADEDDEVSCHRLVHVDDDEELAESSPVYLSSSSTESDSEQEDSECSELAALYSEKPEKDAFFDHQQIQKFEKDAIFDHQQIDKFDKDVIFDHQQIEKFEKDAIFDHQQQQELQVPPNQEKPVLPDCLLLMMCEPKLSMEVSKETWVCSTDFIRWLPDRPPKKSAAKPGCTHDPPVKKPDPSKQHKHLLPEKAENPPPALQPRRSSCSLPPKGPSMAVQIEQKLVNSAAYEPLVLTRCKSEPMRTAAAKLMPDSFYWKNAIRKLEEPHRRATVGAAAGVGC